jgi:hypothetical protein
MVIGSISFLLLTLGARTGPGAPKEPALLAAHPGGHTDEIRTVRFSPHATRLATAHGDGTGKVWAVKDLLGK